MLTLLKIPKVKTMTQDEWKKAKKKMHRNTLLILLPIILIACYELWF